MCVCVCMYVWGISKKRKNIIFSKKNKDKLHFYVIEKEIGY